MIALLATKASGRTIIKDAQELKVKETNRIDVTVRELRGLGAVIESTEDGMVIDGHQEQTYCVAPVSSHGDHRIAMMLCVASLLTEQSLEIEELDSMKISYPEFLVHLQSLIQK